MVSIEGYKHYKIHADEVLASMRRALREQFKFNHGTALRVLDVIVVLAIIFNFGALTITNMLVIKKQVSAGAIITFKEANPAAASVHGFESVPVAEGLRWVFSLVKQSVLLGVLVWFYYKRRSDVYCWTGYWRLCLVVAVLAALLGNDFFHDLGLILGRG